MAATTLLGSSASCQFYYVFSENGLFQNENFLRKKIGLFKILFLLNFVDLDLGFGIVFYSCLKCLLLSPM